MARHWFGGTPADWVFDMGAGNVPVLVPGATVDMYSADTGGTQYTDLLDAGGSPVTSVTTSDGSSGIIGSIPRFQGPDGVRSMWADAAGGARYLMVATDLGDEMAGKIDRSGDQMDGPLTLEDDSLAASRDWVLANGGGSGAPSAFVFSVTGIVSVVTGTRRIYNDAGRTLVIGAVRATVAVAPAGAALLVDVNLDGTTIYTTQASRPSIAGGGFTDLGDTPDVPSWPAGSYLTVDVDQVGSTTPGSDLTVQITAT